MLTVSSIGAAKGAGYARYLESKTVAPERGDYYLSPTGEPVQAPGRWLTPAATRAWLGLDGEDVDGADFLSLMEGRHPRTGAWLRRRGSNGTRGGGIDLTFSAPKSVSAVWALADARGRRALEQAHARAVEQAIGYLTETVPTVRRRHGGALVEEQASGLVAAAYLHTTARGVLAGDAPDPQLHSHVVVTNAVRSDGRTVAVASRPIFRAARELGAFYRSALASELVARGYPIEPGTGRDGRYFEIAGIPKGLTQAFSARSREVARAIERFRAQWGREPERGELRRLKLENRNAKVLASKADLHAAWHDAAARFDAANGALADLLLAARPIDPDRPLDERIEARLSARAAVFEPRELRAVVLEESVGELSAAAALELARSMIAERRVVRLSGDLMTTRSTRDREHAIESRIDRFAKADGRRVDPRLVRAARDQVAERIRAHLNDEQSLALELITGPGHAAVLIGPAGTGKGVVIDAAARAEQLAGNSTHGIAVSGSTAQRLGRDCPALGGFTLTLDALVARVQAGRLDVGPSSTIYFDEAGMADTSRLGALTEIVERTGAKLVLIGDEEQLPSIGAGGMFARLARVAPSAELTRVLRTSDAAERRAWADLRAGRTDRALAHYRARGRLHISDTRNDALESAVGAWASLTDEYPVHEVALLSDASNKEVARLNARAQHYRRERGELGDLEVPIPGVHYGVCAGDRISTIDQHYSPGESRIENGSQGEVLEISSDGVLIEFDATAERRLLVVEDLAELRLGYAQHIHRAQGATVSRALVLTGGWQTSKEPAYVEASRARHGTDWFVNREDLGIEGHDEDRIERLAATMARSRRQVPSLAYRELEPPDGSLHRPRQRGRARIPSEQRIPLLSPREDTERPR
ncbi:MAG TPA: MobF family relaxase [Solirubrobacteraceae bacterium]|nr:MobF family relaxase [Solirubrobacteraceae bacterium]